MREIYLDYNSTCPVIAPVVKEMMNYMEYGEMMFANSETFHKMGVAAKNAVNFARQTIMKLLGKTSGHIIFTSGGTEANNQAIKSVSGGLMISEIEHSSVIESAKSARFVRTIPVDSHGEIRKFDAPTDIELISVMAANNEIGTLQPVDYVIDHKGSAIVHTDACQLFGKARMNLSGVDMISLSAHKIYGPKGVGALYTSKEIPPFMNGGGHEYGMRAGTLNVPGIMGFAKAAERIFETIDEQYAEYMEMKEFICEALLSKFKDASLNTPEHSLPHVLNISFADLDHDVLALCLSYDGVYVSTGSACNSGKISSHVLDAIGCPHNGAIRISMGYYTTMEDIEDAVKIIISNVKELSKGK